MSPLRDIWINEIAVSDRARQIDEAYVEGLAVMIEAEGLLQPIAVRHVGEGYELVAGAHRLKACAALGWQAIPALVVEANETEAVLYEVLENLARNELSALDRARHFARFKRAYEAKYGPIERGGDRKSKAVEKSSKNQSADVALWSFHETIAERTGFSRRTIFAYVAMWQGLDPSQYERLCALPAVAGHFGQLKQLSEQTHDVQDQALGLIETGQAGSVGEALDVIAGIGRKSGQDAVIGRAVSAWSRLSQAQRFGLFDNFEADIRAYAAERGWL